MVAECLGGGLPAAATGADLMGVESDQGKALFLQLDYRPSC